MNTQRDYRLALDINTSAIGLATYRLNEDKQPYKLEHIDVHVFGEPLADAKTGKLKKAQRREKRSMRRQVQRRAQRLKKIAHLFGLVGLTSEKVYEEQKKQSNGGVHKWRSDAVTEKITIEQLMAVFLLMAKNRGYEGRFTKAEDGAVKTSIDEVKKLMEEYHCDTLGQVLYKRKIDCDKNKSAWKKISETGTYAERAMLQDEFNKIWEYQETCHEILKNDSSKDANIKKVYENYFDNETIKSILPRNNKDTVTLRDLFYHAFFDQRPIWWDKETIGTCALEPEHCRTSRAHPVFQEYRIEQLLNDLKFKKRTPNELSTEEKETIRPLFNTQKEIPAKKLYKELGVENDRFTHDRSKESGEDEHKFKGNVSNCVLNSLEKKADMTLNERERELFIEIIADIDEPSFFGYEHWHKREEVQDYFSQDMEKNNETVIAFINLLFKKEEIKTLKSMNLDTGRADYSAEAIKKLLPHIKDGMRPDEARDKVYPDWRKNQHDNLSRVGDSVVQQALKETKHAIDYAIKKHGGQLPAQVVVELSREMKLSQEKRGMIEGIQGNQKKARDTAWEELKKVKSVPNEALCKKYILWIEQKCECAYCGKQLKVEELENTEIDHIVPRAYGGQSNHANLAVVHQQCNQQKANKLPLEAFSGTEKENAIKEMSDTMKKPSYLVKPFNAYKKDVYRRAILLLSENKDDFEGDFKLRQNSETAWIGRELTSYLKQRLNINKTDKGTLEDRVYVSRGTLTAYLRKKCGLNTLIPDIRKEEGKPVFNREGEIMNDGGEHACGSWHEHFTDSNKNYDKRIDHRHHAVDAAIIGLVDRSTFIKATKYYKDSKNHKVSEKNGKKYPTLEGFEKDITLQSTLRPMLKTRLLNYVVWHKPDRKPIDSFFDENIYRCKGTALKLKEDKKLSELAADTFETTKKNLEEYIEGDKNTQHIIKQFTKTYKEQKEKTEKAKCKNALITVESNINKLIKRKKLSEILKDTYKTTKENLDLIVGEHIKQHILEQFETRYQNSHAANEKDKCKIALCGDENDTDDGIFYPIGTNNKVKCVRMYHKVSSEVGMYKEALDKRISVRDARGKEHIHVLNNDGYACFEIVQDKKGPPTYNPVPYHIYWTKEYQKKLRNHDGMVRIYKNDMLYDRKNKEYYVIKQLHTSSGTLRGMKTTETMTYGEAKKKAKQLMKDFGTTKINDMQFIKTRKEIVDTMNTHESPSDCGT